eukprot:TRINITY_DN5592_c0_g1_i1.p1 TRINITY_DN5592_c0_g1~~TRINITY_DN5592_c0_g1_i1.p1  ORF type:complete len:365 (+),score=27.49 TRINITY_DN5592_c0_g1_i1:495-1589(+)
MEDRHVETASLELTALTVEGELTSEVVVARSLYVDNDVVIRSAVACAPGCVITTDRLQAEYIWIEEISSNELTVTGTFCALKGGLQVSGTATVKSVSDLRSLDANAIAYNTKSAPAAIKAPVAYVPPRNPTNSYRVVVVNEGSGYVDDHLTLTIDGIVADDVGFVKRGQRSFTGASLSAPLVLKTFTYSGPTRTEDFTLPAPVLSDGTRNDQGSSAVIRVTFVLRTDKQSHKPVSNVVDDRYIYDSSTVVLLSGGSGYLDASVIATLAFESRQRSGYTTIAKGDGSLADGALLEMTPTPFKYSIAEVVLTHTCFASQPVVVALTQQNQPTLPAQLQLQEVQDLAKQKLDELNDELVAKGFLRNL